MAETDLFFHLKLGDVIRAEHHIPFRNLFSFTYPDAPDQDLAWGFQVLVSLLYAHGGFPAIVLFKTACVVGAATLCHRAARRAGAGPIASAIAIAFALCAADQRLVERPHLITFVGIGALLWLLGEVRRGQTRLLWALPPLALVWANLHAGVFFAFVITTLHLVGARLGGRGVVPARTLVPVLVLTVAASVCTPAGFMLLRYLAWHTGLGSTRIIEEFRSANAWSDPWFFAMLGVCLVGAIRLGRARLDLSLPSFLVALLAARSVRFVAEWAFLSTPLVALTLHELRGLASPRLRRIVAATTTIALISVIGLERRGRRFSISLAEDVVPFAAIDFVTNNGLRERLYHDLDVGCYLLWEGWPRYRVFQDARLPAYPDAFHRALDETPLEPAAFDRLLAGYGVDAALLAEPDINMRAGSFDPEEWALVFRSDEALVFARRTPAHERVIAAREIPLRVRFRFVGGSSTEPIWRPPARSPVSPQEWARRLAIELYAEAHR
jgi:hypothetical protein